MPLLPLYLTVVMKMERNGYPLKAMYLSVRDGFTDAATDDKVKKPSASCWRSTTPPWAATGNLLLNVPVRPPRPHTLANDSTRLMEFRRLLNETFKTNLARTAKVTVTDIRKNNTAVSAKHLADGNAKLTGLRPMTCCRRVSRFYLPEGSYFLPGCRNTFRWASA